MDKFWVIVVLAGLLSSGVESFKLSQKDYENIDRMLEFGVQVFLNCLDKVKEATEEMVKDDMLRTNRIAIQGHWNTFKETANRISVEERGKGAEDDLIVTARTVGRLVQYYKDDVKKIFHSITTEQNVQLYLPVVTMFKGTIKRAKVNEIWGTLVTHYIPDASPIESDPMEFLCHLLSTNTMETFIVNVIKAGVEVMAEYKKFDFEQMKERAWEIFRAVSRKFDEIWRIEREKETDEFFLNVSVASRVFVFYWDGFLNSTDTPLLHQKFEDTMRQLEEQNFLETLQEVTTPIMEWETVKEAWRLHLDFSEEFYLIGLGVIRNFYYYTDNERCSRTARAIGMSAVVQSYPIYEKLSGMAVFSEIKRLYLRAVDVAVALAGDKEFESFRETFYEKWKSFREELNTLVKKERHKSHILLPQVRAIGRMLLEKFVAFLDGVNADIDDDTLRDLSVNWAHLRSICTKKLLASELLTQDQVDEAQRIFVERTVAFFGSYEELTQEMDKKRVEDIFKQGVAQSDDGGT